MSFFGADFRAETFLFLLFIALAGSATLLHEPWRDEAQAWLIARDVDLWRLVTYQSRHEGSPTLWHWLNMPLARLDAPYWTQRALNFAFALGAAALVLWRAPLPLWMRAGTALSYYLLYEYGVIARSYALGTFLLFLALSLYPARWSRPVLFGLVLALLAQASVFGLFFAFGLGLAMLPDGWRPKRRCAAGVLLSLALLGGVVATLQVLPAPDNWRTEGAGLANQFVLRNAAVAFAEALVPTSSNWLPPLAGPARQAALAGLALLTALVWAPLALRLLASPRAAVFFAALAAGVLYLVVFKKTGAPRVHGHLLLGLVAAIWLARLRGEDGGVLTFAGVRVGGRHLKALSNGVLAAGFAVSFMIGLHAVALDVGRPFSGAHAAAKYLREHDGAERPLVAYRAAAAAAVLPYFPGKRAWYPEFEEFRSFVSWTKQWRARGSGLSASEVATLAQQQSRLNGALFLFSKATDDDCFTLLFRSPPSIKGETFYIYRLDPEALARKTVSLPPLASD